MAKEYSAIDIKKLWYADPIFNAASIATLSANNIAWLVADTTGKCVQVKNVHQDTWQIEESESSQEAYRNQLTGQVYRNGKRVMGDLTVNFTIGKYDFNTKKELMGGKLLKSDGTEAGSTDTVVGWARSEEAVDMKKCLIALTVDDIYVIVSNASIGTREASTDGAIGLAVAGVMTESEVAGIASEYWYTKAAIDAITVDDDDSPYASSSSEG